MRILTSTLAALLLLLVGNGLTVHGQAPPPPRGGPDDPPPQAGRQPGRAPDGPRDAANPQRSDIDEVLKDYDADGDGYLTRKELPPSLRERFDRIDTNRDGRLSRRELEQGAFHMHPPQRPSDFVFALVEMSGADRQAQGEVQRLYEVLRRLDTNRDGKIDEDELKAGRQQIVKDRIDFLFKELDTNQDGRISKAEARGQLRQDFNQLDTNRDGFIDRDELMRAATRPPAQPRPGTQPGAERAPAPANPDAPPRRPGARDLPPDAPPPPAPVPGRVPPRRVPQDDGVPPPPR